MNTTTPGKALAIVSGLAFTVGGLLILLGPAIKNPTSWTTYHVLTILTVFGTIAAGHQIKTAWRAGSLACVGYLVVFFVGTCLVVYNSVGNQVEKTGATAASAEDVNARIAEKRSDLLDARNRKRNADRMADKEMTGERCGRQCQAWKQNAKDISATINQTEAEIAALGPQRPVNAKAQSMADVAALFGADQAKARAVLTLIEPFLWTLFFEIGSIVSFGFAFKHAPEIVSPTVSKVSTPISGGGGGRKLSIVEDREVAGVRRVLNSRGTVSNDELADLMGITKGEASKRVARAVELGAVSRVRAGRHVQISLAHAH